MSTRQAFPQRQELRSASFRTLLTRGVLAVTLGVVMLVAPVFTVGIIAVVVVILIGLWLILDGIASCVLAAWGRRRNRRGWGWTLAGGVAAVLSGSLALIFPLPAATAGGVLILWMLAIGLILRGAFEIGDRRLGGWVTVVGLLNIFFGLFICVMLLLNPGAVLLTMVWVVAVYGIAFGLFSVILAFLLRNDH